MEIAFDIVFFLLTKGKEVSQEEHLELLPFLDHNLNLHHYQLVKLGFDKQEHIILLIIFFVSFVY